MLAQAISVSAETIVCTEMFERVSDDTGSQSRILHKGQSVVLAEEANRQLQSAC